LLVSEALDDASNLSVHPLQRFPQLACNFVLTRAFRPSRQQVFLTVVQVTDTPSQRFSFASWDSLSQGASGKGLGNLFRRPIAQSSGKAAPAASIAPFLHPSPEPAHQILVDLSRNESGEREQRTLAFQWSMGDVVLGTSVHGMTTENRKLVRELLFESELVSPGP